MISEHSPWLLIVDDHKSVLDSVSQVLKYSYRIQTALDGQHALNLMDKTEFAVVLLDISMPGKNGLEVLSAAKVKHPHTEIIMLTADNEIDTALYCFERGAFDYLVKPLNVLELRGVVKNATEKHLAVKVAETFLKNFNSINRAKYKLHYPNIQKILDDTTIDDDDDGISFNKAVEAFERMLIEDSLKASDGSHLEAMRRLRMPRTSFFTKISRLKIPLRQP